MRFEVQRFECFFAGPENRSAATVLAAAARKPGVLFNPIYLHGAAGIGKTLLTRSFEARASKQLRGRTVRRIQLAAPVCEGPAACQALTDHPGEVGLLVIEGVDHLDDEQQLHVELRNVCDLACRRRCQVLLTARTGPWELAFVQPSLVSRFVAGLVLAVQAPGVAARRALLDAFAQRHQVPLPSCVSQRLAEAIVIPAHVLPRTVLLLEDAARLERQPITVELAECYIAALSPVSLKLIAERVAGHFHVDIDSLRSGRRGKTITTARHTAMYLARRLTAHSADQIARYFRKRHPSTVSHACRRLAGRLETDAPLQEQLESLASGIVSCARCY